ncbi:LrgB family protein [Rosenbergiella australiborealis]|uniref:LrgB family protein n=1 Tax=Rosenbergiella australiborealis TaxID=1544696 RepID=A0ABS5T3E8_9GAMM|nr:LrgB family protein [Rosenbergiella australiborealis]MBT0725957.1 LrgB family protein [Rosenbergiella australiborealis]
MSSVMVNFFYLLLTVVIYYLNKRLYRRWRLLLLMPLVFTPLVLVAILMTTHIPWQNYIGDNHWLIWLLGPATLAFALPVYENLHLIRRHWMSLAAGVLTAVTVAVLSSVWLARLFSLPEMVERSLAVRSITTPFALAAAKQVGGQPDLVALFVVITGVFGMAVGDILFLRLMITQSIAKGASLGAASHGAGTARAYQLGPEEGVVSSLVMMLAGIVTILFAPLIRFIF